LRSTAPTDFSEKSSMVISTKEQWLSALRDEEVMFSIFSSSRQQNSGSWRGQSDIHSSHLLFYVESGELEGVVDGKRIFLREGSVLWVMPGTRRELWLSKKSKRSVNYRIRFNLFINGATLTYKDSFWYADNLAHTAKYFSIMTELNWINCPKWEKRALLLAIFAALFDTKQSDTGKLRRFTPQQMAIIELAFCKAKGNDADSRKLAAKLGYSQDYFSRLFKNTYGMPAKSYQTLHRLRIAADLLLESNLSLKEICYTLGETNLSKFCRQFKKYFNCTPGQYRKK